MRRTWGRYQRLDTLSLILNEFILKRLFVFRENEWILNNLEFLLAGQSISRSEWSLLLACRSRTDILELVGGVLLLSLPTCYFGCACSWMHVLMVSSCLSVASCCNVLLPVILHADVMLQSFSGNRNTECRWSLKPRVMAYRARDDTVIRLFSRAMRE